MNMQFKLVIVPLLLSGHYDSTIVSIVASTVSCNSIQFAARYNQEYTRRYCWTNRMQWNSEHRSNSDFT
jgi:hypothetical protein